jgi:hypothetical protein
MATYRQLTTASGGTLEIGQTCPTCSNSWRAQVCGQVQNYYLDTISGYDGSQGVLLQYSYSVGDVVWVKQSANGAISCAEILAISSTPSNAKIDEAGNNGSGPYSACSNCNTP